MNHTDPTGHIFDFIDIGMAVLLMGTLALMTDMVMYAISGSEQAGIGLGEFNSYFLQGVGRSLIFFAGLLWFLGEKLAHASGVLHGLTALAAGLAIFGVVLDVSLFWMHVSKLLNSPNVSNSEKEGLLLVAGTFTALGLLSIVSVFFAPELAPILMFIVAVLGEVLDYALEPIAERAE